MGQIIGRMMFGLMFCGLMGTVVLYTIDAQVRTSNSTPVIIVLTGLFTVLFGFASLMERPSGQQIAPGATQEDLHRAYQAGYELVDRQNQRQLDYQERAYQAQLATQERQHATTVNAFVTLSLADKQTVREALRAGIRLVQADRQLMLRFADGRTQPVSQFADMTPDKLRYMAAAQQSLQLGDGGNVVEAQYRELY